jgi:ABC-type uncharacterized transport system permease subunit
MPSTAQIILLILAILLFLAGGVCSVLRIWSDRKSLPFISKACLWAGVAVSLSLILWHTMTRQAGNWLPLEDNFEAFIWLAVLLAGFVLYVQRRRPLGGLDWFVMPIVILLLVGAAVFGRTKPHEYDVRSVWLWTHRVTAYGGAVGFAVAGAVGAMYLIVNRRLRDKTAGPGPNLGSLERLEHLTLASVTLGFALLTIGTITGVVRMFEEDKGTPPAKNVAIALAVAVWVVYGVVLHSPINPSFRGRRAAVLSVVGFVLMVGTIFAVQFT